MINIPKVDDLIPDLRKIPRSQLDTMFEVSPFLLTQKIAALTKESLQSVMTPPLQLEARAFLVHCSSVGLSSQPKDDALQIVCP